MTDDEMANRILRGIAYEREQAKLKERTQVVEYILGEATALNMSRAQIAQAIAAGEHVLLDEAIEPGNT